MLEKLDPEELDRRSDRRAAIDELRAGTLSSMWVDIDATNGVSFSNRDGSSLGIDEAVAAHIGAIQAWLDSLDAASRNDYRDQPKRIGF
jgi:uncharacterized protein